MPFLVLPTFRIWGKFTTGKNRILLLYILEWKIFIIFYLFLEGFLTACSFDFLTEDYSTKMFVGAIVIWAFVIPMSLIVFFYSRLLKSVKSHEKMMKDEVFKKFLIRMK